MNVTVTDDDEQIIYGPDDKPLVKVTDKLPFGFTNEIPSRRPSND